MSLLVTAKRPVDFGSTSEQREDFRGVLQCGVSVGLRGFKRLQHMRPSVFFGSPTRKRGATHSDANTIGKAMRYANLLAVCDGRAFVVARQMRKCCSIAAARCC